jgi:spore coat protein A, manganese oxidase
MDLKHRRDFLKLCAASLPGLAFANRIDAQEAATHGSAQRAYRTPASLERYIDPLPIPKRLLPHGTHKGAPQYRVRMLEFKQQLHSQLPPTKLWGYEGQYPGPIFEVQQGRPIEVRWENHLPTQHIFQVDPHIHGAMPPAPAVRTVPHLHGSRTQSYSDGLPEKWFTPGHSALYQYPNDQAATTLWYHDHAVGITRLNVYAGLSGFYFLRDEFERRLNLPSGDYEIPLILQDRTLDPQGQLVYAPAQDDAIPLSPGLWGPMFFGELPVVNGAIGPYIEVEPRPYRLRMLNGCNSRFLRLYFNLARDVTDIPNLVPVHQIGSDGGFLPAPVKLQKFLLGPAERADLILDFSLLAGRTVTLCNDAAAPFPGWNVLNAKWPAIYEFMQFRVTRPVKNPRSYVMPLNFPFAGVNPADAVRTRDFVLTEVMDDKGRSLGLNINGKGYDDPVTEIIPLNSIEKWRFINTSDDAHPMHLHLVQFQVLGRQGFNIPAMTIHNSLQFVGVPRKPQPGESGWKDTAVVEPGDVLTILVKFTGYTGRYVFHCHMLEHEDNDMMRPFEVAPVPSEPAKS